ncbi:MAG TPA: NosD domain-containing protein [Methanothrix sp.]|nr:NosD domain-containing protein [Methanothrix sp.]
MLDDHIHRLAIGTWLALALILSAGLVQAVVSDDINESAVVEDLLPQETNASSDVAEGTANDSENFTEALALIDNVTGLNDTTTIEAGAEADLSLPPATNETESGAIDESLNDSLNESLNESLKEPITVTAPEEAEGVFGEAVHAVCLNGCNFTSIQAAIEAAGEGDVIEVGSGTYNEKIVLEKSVTIRGVDTGEGVPVIDAKGNGSAVLLEADGIVLEGLYITNAGPYPSAGIEVVSNDNLISGCGIMNSDWAGIYIKGSSNTTITGCISSNNGNDGILIFRAAGNLVSDSVVSNNLDDGISILSSDSNRIEGNVLVNNTKAGIFLDATTNAVVTGNVIGYNALGISLRDSGIDRVGPNRFFNNTVNLEGV